PGDGLPARPAPAPLPPPSPRPPGSGPARRGSRRLPCRTPPYSSVLCSPLTTPQPEGCVMGEEKNVRFAVVRSPSARCCTLTSFAFVRPSAFCPLASLAFVGCPFEPKRPQGACKRPKAEPKGA